MRPIMQPPPLPLITLGLAGLLGMGALAPLAIGSATGFYLFMTAHLALAIHGWLPAAESALFDRVARECGVKRSNAEIAFVRYAQTAGVTLMTLGALVAPETTAPLDYLPHFASPLFVVGMGLIYAGWLVAASWPLRGWSDMKKGTGLPGFVAAGGAAWISAVNFFVAAIALPAGLPGGYALQTAVYGAGHTLQFVHVMIMTTLWGIALGSFRWPWAERLAGIGFAFGLGLILWSPAIHATIDPVEQTHTLVWTLLLGIGLGLVAMITGGAAIVGLREWRGSPLVGLAVIAFAFGSWVPGMSDRTALSLTAHYHGMLGAISAIYLAILYERPPYRESLTFGAGTLLIGVGFAKVAHIPLPRKTATLTGLWEIDPVATGMVVVGALMAGGAALHLALTMWRKTKKGEAGRPPLS